MRSIVGSARLILLAVVIVILFFLVVGVFPVVPDSMRVRMVKRWAPRVLRVLGIRLDVKGRIPNAEAASGLREDGPGYLVAPITYRSLIFLCWIPFFRCVSLLKKKFQSGRFSD